MCGFGLGKIKKQNSELYRICYLSARGAEKPKIEKLKNKGLDVEKIIDCLRNIKTIRKAINGDVKEKFDNSLQKIAYLFKDSHYYSEEETRLIIADNVFDENTSTTKGESDIDVNNCPYLFKYANFIPYIKEIIIGPKFEKADFNFPFIKFEIEKMCKSLNYSVPKITFSDIDYR